jgi:HlyD family secretion protein
MIKKKSLYHSSILSGVLVFAVTATAQPGPTNVTVAEAIARDVSDGQVFVGSIIPAHTSAVGTAVDGRVLALPVEAGDFVTAGQTLAQLRTRTIEAQLASARAQRDLRRQELAELQRGARPEEIEQANARMLGNKARMDNAKRNFERIRRIHETLSAADNELDDAHAIAIETEQNFLEAKAAYNQIVAGPRIERIAQAKARAAVEDEEVQRLEDLVRKYTIVAPFDGFVTLKGTEVGEWVTRGQTVAEVVDLTSVDVEVRVLEDYIAKLTVGEVATVTVSSHPGRVFTGTIRRIIPFADSRSRSFPVRIRVANEIHDNIPLLMAGMFAEATIGIGSPVTTTLVPKDAIVLGGRTPVVYLVVPTEGDNNNATVREVFVSVGVAVNELIAIRGVVEPKSLVVVRGNERLRPGQQVIIADRIDTERLLNPPEPAK